MKKLILTLFVVVFILVLSFFVMGISRKIKENNASENQISTLPLFSLPELNGRIFSTSEINRGPVLLVRFHPECEHCTYELKELFRSGLADREVMVLLVSGAPKNDVNSFLNQFDVSGKDNIIPLTDTAYLLSDIFSKNVIPSNYIYDKELKLVKALYGEYKIETILKYLEVSE
ncbi:MAG TPA: hypothetical protein DDY34_11885 [Bacteroidales bacterium]|nr:hypothetical protein [Bacteroidales bacterium]